MAIKEIMSKVSKKVRRLYELDPKYVDALASARAVHTALRLGEEVGIVAYELYLGHETSVASALKVKASGAEVLRSRLNGRVEKERIEDGEIYFFLKSPTP